MIVEVGYCIWISEDICEFIVKRSELQIKKSANVPVYTANEANSSSLINQKKYFDWFQTADRKGEHAVFVGKLYFNSTNVIAHVTIAGKHYYIQLVENGKEVVDFLQFSAEEFQRIETFEKCPMMMAEAYKLESF